MTGVGRVPRSRGGVSGVLLILLGAWGGLAPFIGPYFHYAYTPDRAWAYTSGRLWLSIAPGAAAVVGGLLIVIAGHRAVGITGGVLGVLGGGWFILGTAITAQVVKNGSISPGLPLTGTLGPFSSTERVFLESLGFFAGTGVLIVFLAALALGRFSVVGVRDAALAEELSLGSDTEYGLGPEPGPAEAPSTTGEFPTVGAPFPPAAEPPETMEEQYPTTTSPFRRPPPDPGPLRGPG